MAKSDKHFDLIIIGGGPGGISAALRAEELNVKTLFVNGGLPLGGTCLHMGCVPYNRLMHVAQSMHDAQKGFAGIEFRLEHLDFKALMADVQDLMNYWQMQDEKTIKGLKHVYFKKGWAHFVTPYSVNIGSCIYSADVFIIAAGASAYVPQLEGLHATGFLTHADIFSLKELPDSLLIIGGGSFGLECAQIFNRLGCSVTVIEESSRLLKRGNKELVDSLESILRREGIRFCKNVQIQRALNHKGRKLLLVETSRGRKKFEAQEIVVALGKKPLTSHLRLSLARVATDCAGGISVDAYLKTSEPHIFAVGDVLSIPMRIETTAVKEGRMAVDNAFNNAKQTIDYTLIPYSLSTDPALSFVGIGKSDKDHYTISLPMEYVTYASIVGYTEGSVKLFVHSKTERICGLHMLARGSQEVISHAASLIHARTTLYDIQNSTFVFPSYAHVFKMLASQRKS